MFELMIFSCVDQFQLVLCNNTLDREIGSILICGATVRIDHKKWRWIGTVCRSFTNSIHGKFVRVQRKN